MRHERSAVVHDFVMDVLAASAEALALHFQAFFASIGDAPVPAIATALDHGYDADLEEFVSPDQVVGFNHFLVGSAFRRKDTLAELRRESLSHQIWQADERNEIYSLFGPSGRGGSADSALRGRRTRVSAIVQRALRDSRSFRQAEKATTTTDLTRFVTIPSPLYIAHEVLTDPRNPPSGTYAAHALQELIKETLERSTGGALDLSYEALSEALSTVNNRWRTSKPVVANIGQNGATTIFLCHVFAIRGYMAMRVDVQALARSGDAGTDASPLGRDQGFFHGNDADRGQEGSAEFMVNPHYVELPNIGQVMNLLHGLPLPIEGADIVFQGGLRLSVDHSIVAGLSGTFGAGKTMFGLSLAAVLAPLGCRTLYLSCEESARDLHTRLLEAAPPSLFRNAPLFRAVNREAFRRSRSAGRGHESSQSAADLPWFVARQIEMTMPDGGPEVAVNPAGALANMLADVLESAEVFQAELDDDAVRPHFARPIVVVDGLHQLFEAPETHVGIDASLRMLIERCRNLGAVVVFSFSSEFAPLKRLEYLCDLIIELGREGFERPAETPKRYFQLLKARRQPTSIGAHVFHLKGDAGFRLKPSANAWVQASKNELWWDPDARSEVFLGDEPPQGFADHPTSLRTSQSLPVRNRSQVLVLGRGSSGKAGFGLYLLHRRWFDSRMLGEDHEREQLSMLVDGHDAASSLAFASKRRAAIHDAKLPVWYEAPYLETRVLVISFLYQSSYYDELTSRLSSRRRGKASRKSAQMGPIQSARKPQFTPLPDRMRTDTMELYPGMLSVEDFIAKVDKKLSTAEGLGLPYTGVLIDGLHNVFVQFPALEAESSFWGMFYNILRRRRLMVVTTHTEFGLSAGLDFEKDRRPQENAPMVYNFEQAQRKIAPLLSALVSGADYLFELSTHLEGRLVQYRLTPRGSIGYDIGNFSYGWDRNRLRLEGAIGPASR